MRKFIVTSVLAAAIVVVVAPVIISRSSTPEKRDFEAAKLDDSRFQEVSFRNREHDIQLAGLLFLPQGDGPFPAAVLIHGSGTSHRENRWYLTLTHYLQDHGVAVLLPDKRGSAKSQGNWRTASLQDLAGDTVAAIEYLRHQWPGRILEPGVIGLSQGGWIAPFVAEREPAIAFLVSVVGAIVPTHDQLIYEEINNLRQAGFLPVVSDGIAYLSTAYLRKVSQKEFWDAVGNFDPLPYWQRLNVPALALFGSEDSNVPSQRSAHLLHSLARPNIEVVVFEGSGHALEDPVGQGNDYFRKDALQTISDFITATSPVTSASENSHQ